LVYFCTAASSLPLSFILPPCCLAFHSSPCSHGQHHLILIKPKQSSAASDKQAQSTIIGEKSRGYPLAIHFSSLDIHLGVIVLGYMITGRLRSLNDLLYILYYHRDYIIIVIHRNEHEHAFGRPSQLGRSSVHRLSRARVDGTTRKKVRMDARTQGRKGGKTEKRRRLNACQINDHHNNNNTKREFGGPPWVVPRRNHLGAMAPSTRTRSRDEVSEDGDEE